MFIPLKRPRAALCLSLLMGLVACCTNPETVRTQIEDVREQPETVQTQTDAMRSSAGEAPAEAPSGRDDAFQESLRK